MLPPSFDRPRSQLPAARTVGFIGLGHIGEPMAARVAAAYPVVVYDIDPQAGAGLPGVARAGNLAELVRGCDLVLMSLPDGAASHQVVREITAVPEARARLIVELSTVGPTWAARCCEHATAAGWRYLDAPVSGGRQGAASGTLSTMVAGRDDDRAAAEPVLRSFAATVFPVGRTAGLGQAMKLTNNAIALAVLPVTSEALSFGAAHGLDPHTMIDVINASSGRTQRSEGMFPRSILSGAFDHGATGEITHKDMALYVDEVARIGLRAAIGPVVSEIYAGFVATHPRTDYSYLHVFVERSCGLRTSHCDQVNLEDSP